MLLGRSAGVSSCSYHANLKANTCVHHRRHSKSVKACVSNSDFQVNGAALKSTTSPPVSRKPAALLQEAATETHDSSNSSTSSREDSSGGSSSSDPGSQPSSTPSTPEAHSSSSSSSTTPSTPITTLSSSSPVPVSPPPPPPDGSVPILAAVGVAGGIAVLLGGGYFFRDYIQHFLNFFIVAVDEWGPLGYAAYAGVYIILEVLAVPAIPLTMTAGVIFNPVVGTLVTSLSATIAATIAFLIARYLARDKIRGFASKNPRFAAIDRAIGKDGLKFVTLLRLSPLLPSSASNYLYGLTSVDLGPYILGSWVGMLPGTFAFVSAGHAGKAVLTGVEGGTMSLEIWQIVLGLSATAGALGFVGALAKKAIDEADSEDPVNGSGGQTPLK